MDELKNETEARLKNFTENAYAKKYIANVSQILYQDYKLSFINSFIKGFFYHNKEKSISKNYISLIKNKNSPLVNNLKCEKRHLSKSQYSNYSDLSYDVKKLFNKDSDKIEIKLMNMIQYKNKKLLFVLKNEDIIIYEIIDEPFSLIHLQTLFSNNFMMTI